LVDAVIVKIVKMIPKAEAIEKDAVDEELAFLALDDLSTDQIEEFLADRKAA
jgi:hypothetical protein